MKRLILIASIMLGGLTISQAYRQTETTHIEKQQEQEWQRGQTITLRPGQSADELAALFAITPIDEATEKRMREGGSYKDECPIPLADLRYLHLVHYDYDERIVCGEMVCHKIIAQKLIDVFTELFLAHYPIASIRLIDDFGANDEVSMSHNNSSCFCYRAVTGGKTLSRHARGLAVDINPLHNPYVKINAQGGILKVEPNTPEAKAYAKRTPRKAHMIDHSDACYKAFTQQGFFWGGAWRTIKGYQHFEWKR